ncbi:MAG: hypothetical protein U0638_09325 [Phycisphaerales bacterium]
MSDSSIPASETTTKEPSQSSMPTSEQDGRAGGELRDDDGPSDFDLVKFLWERAHAESTLFWNRNAVFLVIHPLAFAKCVELLVSGKLAPLLLLVLSMSGVVFSAIWFYLTFRGRQYAHWYLEDAKKIAAQHTKIASRLVDSLKTRGEAAASTGLWNDVLKLRHGEASSWMYAIAAWFGAGWMAFAIYAMVDLLDGKCARALPPSP